ncbi:MAG TPA: efflux RND transporter periplasmic adaptor subunit [Steroidobacteraceae bacterium]|nr:efflux RND transporter periplasmic adaptor subunit [Steroidobacteraceae bacterium]
MTSLSRAKTAGFSIVLAALAALTAACGDQQDTPEGGAPVPVTIVTLRSEKVTLTRELPGRSTAYLVAEVRPQVDGIVLKRLFTEGGLVKQGQPLYQIDDATYRADLNSARANVVRAQATLETADLDAKRSAQLVRVDAVSQQDDENAAAALRHAQADLKAAQAAADRAATVLGYARIVAPISGRIGRSSVTQGALVTANQAEPLATVQQLDPIYVDLTQSSAEWLQLRRELASGRLAGASDLPVTIVLEDGSPYEHTGKLAFSEVSVDPTTGSFALRVVVPNPDHVLLPGMYVRAVIGRGVRENGVLVPQQGIARDPKGGTTAMIVGADEKVEVREVRVSQTIGDKWLVEEGLAPGDRVVVEGLQKIRPGALVQATEAATPAATRTAAQK